MFGFFSHCVHGLFLRVLLKKQKKQEDHGPHCLPKKLNTSAQSYDYTIIIWHLVDKILIAN